MPQKVQRSGGESGVLLTLLAMLPVAPALAQPAHIDDALASRNLAPLLRQLDSESFDEREAAADALRANGEIGLREVLALLKESGTLTPEQRARLITLARGLFLETPRAAMGIQFGGVVEEGITISALVEGFDAARALKPGDVIERVEGRAMSQGEFRASIIARDPGDAMTLRVRRDGESEPIDVRVVLGQFSRLRGGAYLDTATLLDAWRIRLAHSGVIDRVVGPTIAADIDPELWRQHDELSMRRLTEMHTSHEIIAPGSMVGGEPRATWRDGMVESLEWRGGSSRRFDAEELLRQQEVAQIRIALQALQVEIEGLRTAQRLNAQTMQQSSLAVSERTRLKVENERLVTRIAELESFIAELRVQLNRRQ
jgi:hypothetical protein